MLKPTLVRYTSVIVFPILYFGYKFVRKTKLLKPSEANLYPPELEDVNQYQANYIPTRAHSMFERILDKMFG